MTPDSAAEERENGDVGEEQSHRSHAAVVFGAQSKLPQVSFLPCSKLLDLNVSKPSVYLV